MSDDISELVLDKFAKRETWASAGGQAVVRFAEQQHALPQGARVRLDEQGQVAGMAVDVIPGREGLRPMADTAAGAAVRQMGQKPPQAPQAPPGGEQKPSWGESKAQTMKSPVGAALDATVGNVVGTVGMVRGLVPNTVAAVLQGSYELGRTAIEMANAWAPSIKVDGVPIPDVSPPDFVALKDDPLLWPLGQAAEALSGTPDIPGFAQGNDDWGWQMYRGMAKFMIPFVGSLQVMKGLGVARALGGGRVAQSFEAGLAGLPVDFAFSGPHEGNLGNLMEQLGVLPEYSKWIAGRDHDGFFEGKLKNALDGFLAGVGIDAATGALRAMVPVLADAHRQIRALDLDRVEREAAAVITNPNLAYGGGPGTDQVLASLRWMGARIGKGLTRLEWVNEFPPARQAAAGAFYDASAAELKRGGWDPVGVRLESADTVEKLYAKIPHERRVAGREFTPGEPVRDIAGRQYMDRPDLSTPGRGLRDLDTEGINRIWLEALAESGATPSGMPVIDLARDLGMWPKDAEFWDNALRNAERFRYWYETSTEAVHRYLPGLTKDQYQRFFQLMAATSPQADPFANMLRALDLMAYDLQGRPAETGIIKAPGADSAPRKAFSSQDLEGAKVHNFSSNFEFLAGYRRTAPLSTNDRQVAAYFGVSGETLAQRGYLYEPVSRFHMKLRDWLNERLDAGEEPYQTWQIQALGWTQQGGGGQRLGAGGDYMGALQLIRDQLEEAGLVGPGQPITREVLEDPRIHEVLDPKTLVAQREMTATQEVMSKGTPMGGRVETLLKDPRVVTNETSMKGFQKALIGGMADLHNTWSYKIKIDPEIPGVKPKTTTVNLSSPLSSLVRGVKGVDRQVNLTRIDLGWGSFQGEVSRNIRVPLVELTVRGKPGAVPMSPVEQRAFLAILGREYGQAAEAASIFHVVRETDPVGMGWDGNPRVRTHSFFIQSADYKLDKADVDSVLRALPPGHEVNAWEAPNGVVVDVVPRFEDSGPVGVSQAELQTAVDTTFGGTYDVGVYATDFESHYLEKQDYDPAIGDLYRTWRDEAAREYKSVHPLAGDDQIKEWLTSGDQGGALRVAVSRRLAGARDRYLSRVDVLDRAVGEVSGARASLDERLANWTEDAAKRRMRKDMRPRYRAAEKALPQFDSALDRAAGEAGVEPLHAPLKGEARASEKVLFDYLGDVSKLKDLVRGSLMIREPGQAQAAVESVYRNFEVVESGARNLLTGPDSIGGYRDAKFNVKLPDGSLGEVQVIPAPMWDAKLAMHALYEELSTMERRAARQPYGRMTPQQALRWIEITDEMKAGFDKAWAEFTGSRQTSGSQTAPGRLETRANAPE